MNHKIFFSLLLLTVSLSLAATKTIQVPYVANDDTLFIRFEQLTRMDKVFNVFGHLKRIYKKEVYEIATNGSETEFSACYEQAPQASFYPSSTLYLEGQTINRDAIIYDFDLIKYPRNLIDVEVYNNKIYYAKEDGTITIAQISDDLSKIVAKKRMKTLEQKLAEGNIVILPEATDGQKVGFGIFITRNEAILFDLDGDNFTQLLNFNPMKGFQSTIPIQDNFFAAAFAEDGCRIYSIDFTQKQLKVQHSFNKQSFNLKSINIQDLAYDANRKLLFILDRNTGVTPVQLSFEGSTLEVRSTSSTIKNNYCNVIYYDSFNDELYLNCRELHKYMIKDWPLISEKVLPRQQISIRQITSTQGVVALVGRNVFELISQERKVAVYDDKLLDKLIIKDNMFLSGNQHYFLAGRYEVIPPSLSCSPENKSSIGKHKVLFKITAQCNQEYLRQINFSTQSIGKDDKCVYSIYQNVKIWQGKPLDVKIFMVVGIVIAVLGLAVLAWWGCSYLNLRKLRNQYLNHYNSLENIQEGQRSSVSGEKPFEAVVEMKGTVEKATDKQGRHELNEDVDVPENIHDIE